MNKKIFILITIVSLQIPGTVFASQAPNYEFGQYYDAYTFGTPTTSSLAADTSHIANVRKNKDVAYFPPAYGIFGGDIPTNQISKFHEQEANKSTVTQIPDFGGIAEVTKGVYSSSEAKNASGISTNYQSNTDSYYNESITSVEEYSDGRIGRIQVSKYDADVKVYNGTSDSILKKGAGHFTYTSMWDGNVAICGHNRGTYGYFSFVKNLEIGDKIKYTTKEGSRTYEVYRVTKISETDYSYFDYSSDNIITLVTCVENQSDLRWCVQAKEVK